MGLRARVDVWRAMRPRPIGPVRPAAPARPPPPRGLCERNREHVGPERLTQPDPVPTASAGRSTPARDLPAVTLRDKHAQLATERNENTTFPNARLKQLRADRSASASYDGRKRRSPSRPNSPTTGSSSQAPTRGSSSRAPRDWGRSRTDSAKLLQVTTYTPPLPRARQLAEISPRGRAASGSRGSPSGVRLAPAVTSRTDNAVDIPVLLTHVAQLADNRTQTQSVALNLHQLRNRVKGRMPDYFVMLNECAWIH